MKIELTHDSGTTALKVTDISDVEGASLYQQISYSNFQANLRPELALMIVKEMAPCLTSLIAAIKLYRYLTICELKDAKNEVESLGVQCWGNY